MACLAGLEWCCTKILAGHSLGEYSALVAAEAMTLADAVKLVNLRGKLMQCSSSRGEAMAAILGLTDDKVIELCQKQCICSRLGSVEAANYNAQGQVVIAGRYSLWFQQVMAASKDNQVKRLHCLFLYHHIVPWWNQQQKSLLKLWNKLPLSYPRIPVIQNVNAEIATDVAQLRSGAHCAQLYPVSCNGR